MARICSDGVVCPRLISIVEGRDEGEVLVGREVCIRVMLEVVVYVEDDILTDPNSTVGVLG